MTNYEMVEQLREKANVSYEEAKRALEETNWDLLEAIVLLEKQGVAMKGSTDYSTKSEPVDHADEADEKESGGFRDTMHLICAWIKKIFRIACDNSLVLSRKGKEILAVPVIVPVILLFPAFWAELIVLIVGLFLGVRYSFRGPTLGTEKINEVIGRATDAAETVKNELNRRKENGADAENIDDHKDAE